MSVSSRTDHIQIARVIGMRPLTDAIFTEPDAPLPVAVARMALAGTAQLLVMHGGRLLGLLTMSGVIRRLNVREELTG